MMKPTASQHSNRILKAAVSLTAALMVQIGPARAMEGPARTSDADLNLDHAFHFSQGGFKTLPSSDCKFAPEAKAYFDVEARKGNTLRVLQQSEARRFVNAAYRGKLSEQDKANLDLLVVEKLKDSDYRVYPGSTMIMERPGGTAQPIFCGFLRSQFLPTEWAEAGFQDKTLFTTLPDPTPFEQALKQLSLGYAGQGYDLVRDSLRKRGFSPVKQQEAVVDRCPPGLESICETYAEAVCKQQVWAGKTCYFQWRSGGDEDVVIAAEIGYVSARVAQITVVSVDKLPKQAN